jgi:RNA polymerase sigma-70 factor (ECF subfamily)
MGQPSDNATISDEALLAAVAKDRDRAAFDELFRRYERAAYSMASSIIGSSHLAEEVAQDSMMKLWTLAGQFRGDGCVRSWLLRIVARQSINTIRSAKIRRDRERKVSDEPIMNESLDEQLSVSELANALQASLQRLPELERRLIALHFGCGISQPEISAELGIPQQTVSYKLTQTLGRLRSGLAAAGFSALIPLLDNGGLSDALCEMANPPASLRKQVYAKMFKSSARRTQRLIRGKTGMLSSSAAVAGLAVAVALVAAALINGRPAAVPPKLSPTPVAPPLPEPSLPKLPDVVAPADERTSYHWVFDKGVSDDFIGFKLGENMTFTWSKENGGEMLTDDRGYVQLKVPVNGRPFILTCTGRMRNDKGTFSFGANVLRNKNVDMKQSWLTGLQMKASLDFKSVTSYSGEWMMERVNDQLIRITQMRDSHGEIIFLCLQNLAIREIELRFVKPEELPPEFKAPEALTKNMAVEKYDGAK